MIICQCNVISCTQLKSATERLSACDPHCIVTPGAVFRACGVRPQCGGCMLNVTEIIVGAMQQRQQLD